MKLCTGQVLWETEGGVEIYSGVGSMTVITVTRGQVKRKRQSGASHVEQHFSPGSTITNAYMLESG